MNIKTRLENLERTRNRKISVREMSDEELLEIIQPGYHSSCPIREISNEELLAIVGGNTKRTLNFKSPKSGRYSG